MGAMRVCFDDEKSPCAIQWGNYPMAGKMEITPIDFDANAIAFDDDAVTIAFDDDAVTMAIPCDDADAEQIIAQAAYRRIFGFWLVGTA